MTSALSFRKLLVPHALAALAGLALGCVITTGGGAGDPEECGTLLSHSQMTTVGCEPGETECCKCDPGYQWEDPGDPDNFECDQIPPKSGCDCDDPHTSQVGGSCELDPGWTWCSNDPNDCSACEDPDQGPGGTGQVEGDDGVTDDNGDDTADTGADDGVDETGGGGTCEEVEGEWNGVEPPADGCTMDGLAFCSNTESEGPAGSRYWECMGGEWVEQPTVGDEICQFDNFDFAYGCYDTADGVQFECGIGPGTPCSGPECDGCSDADTHTYCLDNKLGAESCTELCTVVGDPDGITYDMGECLDDADGTGCCCFDEGSEECVLL